MWNLPEILSTFGSMSTSYAFAFALVSVLASACLCRLKFHAGWAAWLLPFLLIPPSIWVIAEESVVAFGFRRACADQMAIDYFLILLICPIGFVVATRQSSSVARLLTLIVVVVLMMLVPLMMDVCR